MTYRRKLIEVALPLDDINRESAREKSIRHGHPSTLHLWWARRPLASCRAVLFASLVDDPGNDLPEDEAIVERERLFGIIRDLVKWENSSDEKVLSRARAEITKSTNGKPPPVLDPFCGGGSIPLEAQRLGLEAHGSDLNPVAVMITKALIELPPKFSGLPPVNPEARKSQNLSAWRGAQGLAEDVRHYGAWMRDEAKRRIGDLYPTGPDGETVIAWLWARTVRCPNPACGATMPLVSSFWLSKKKGKQAWVEPVVEGKGVRFEVKGGEGEPPDPPKLGRGAKFRCLVCAEISEDDHIKAEGKAGRMGRQLMAVVAEGRRGRKYLPATEDHVRAAESAKPEWGPEQRLPDNTRWFSPPVFGMDTFDKLFTPRQLVALTTFSDLAGEARERVGSDAGESGLDEGRATAYADAVATYLAFAVSRLSDICNSLCRWESTKTQVRNLFGRQAIPMIWDFAEPNVFADAAGNYEVSLGNLIKALIRTPARVSGEAHQQDATTALDESYRPVISTDPPYYDNIGYADLSDFFYVWLRRSLGGVYPDVFGTMLVPKAPELVATPYRFGGSKQRAREFFESGLGRAFARMRERANPDYPVTIYYAFKQAENETVSTDGEEGSGVMAVASTGWETMLTGLMESGFQITGTWPMRTELSNRPVATGTNALASSVVMVCRARAVDAPVASRREFQNALRRELPGAVSVMIRENISPVDLAQATIGPGMAIYSRYSSVVENDGSPLTVRTALQMINAQLSATLHEQEGDLDDESRFCLRWFDQSGYAAGGYGEAETMFSALNISGAALRRSGVVKSGGGKVRLLRRDELPEGWDPDADEYINVWERAQHLVKAVLEGEEKAARLVKKIGAEDAEEARQLAFLLYQVCDRKKWPEEAFAYNALSQSWERVMDLSRHEEEGALF